MALTSVRVRGRLQSAVREITNLGITERRSPSCRLADVRQVTGWVEVFGRHVPWRLSPDWHWSIENEERWPAVDWWRIDIRSGRRIADVKWTWEAGRHAHVVLLARGAAGGHDDAFEVLQSQLRSFLAQSPPEIGVHWYSNLEIALRAVAWAQVLALVGDRLDQDLRDEMAMVLRHSGRHLLVELPYTLSSMRNNHLLGDALGMIVMGEMFRTTREGRVLAGIGNRMFRRQLQRQIHADGSMIEDSVSYHRFVLEMLAIRALLPGDVDDVGEALIRAAQFLFRLGVGEGPVPQYGDWDEGRVLVTAGDRLDLLGSARSALALGGTGAPPAWHEEHDEVAWYAAVGEPVPPQPAETAGHDIGGGIARAATGRFTVWLKAGSQPSHGHADLCSVAIALDQQWVVGDPGTGTYNGPIEQRNYFRSSIAHDVLRVGGEDQLVPHRAFRWQHRANGVVGPPLRTGEGVLMWGAHDAYRRLTPGRRVARTVLVSASRVVVADWVEGPAMEYALSFPLLPGAVWDGGRIVLPKGGVVHLAVPGEASVHHGQSAPYDGWWSRTYGHAEPATRLEVRGRTAGPVVWSVALEAAEAATTIRDGRVVIGDTELEVEWREGGAVMRHRVVNGDEQAAMLELG